ncbi:MAG TPA: hypothetical protein PLX69_24450, partial [Leptospiraceae bacterium]|nr:hypothetical protein [Leptospiraceae bacterium]
MTGVFAVIPVAVSAGDVEVTDGSKDVDVGAVAVVVGEFDVDDIVILPKIAVIVPIMLGLGLLTSKGERFAFKQFNKINGNTNIIKKIFFIFEPFF